MITRERIIIGVVLIAVVAGFIAVYMFYFQDKMEAYAANKRFMDDLDRTYADISATFSGYDPDDLIALWKQQVQPWADNRNELATYYHLDGWRVHDAPPEEVAIAKFWYEEQAQEMESEFYQYLYEKMGDYRNRFPNDLRATLGVKKLEDWQGVDVNVGQVRYELGNLQFGINLSKFLIDHNVAAVRNINVWPVRKEEQSNKLLDFVTVGLEVTMTLEDFVKFMDDLRTAPRYFTVDSVSMSYPYIMYQDTPYIDIKLLFTQSTYTGPRTVDQAGSAGAEAAFANAALTSRQGDQQQIQQPSFMDKAWKWFKNNILYMN